MSEKTAPTTTTIKHEECNGRGSFTCPKCKGRKSRGYKQCGVWFEGSTCRACKGNGTVKCLGCNNGRKTITLIVTKKEVPNA